MFEIDSSYIIEKPKANVPKAVDNQGSSFFNHMAEAVQSVDSQFSLHTDKIESASIEPVKAKALGSYLSALLDIKHEGTM